MKKKTWRIFWIALIILPMFVWIGCQYFKSDEGIHIALAGPMSKRVGEGFIQAVEAYLEGVNKAGGINGKKIILDTYDDQNDSAKAGEKALEIVKDNRALAVIGHSYSSCSISAGKVYKEHGIPAISPASTNVNVTKDNEWYFRTIFDDNIQGKFLANYVKRMLKQDSVSIIYQEDMEYGTYLTQVFEETANTIGLEIKNKWPFRTKAEDRLQQLEEIAAELVLQKEDAGAIFLAMHKANDIVRLIKDAGLKNLLIAPDALTTMEFVEGFSQYKKEIENPGYYTNGIYVTTPLIFDTANELAQKFRRDYIRKYHKEPDANSPFAYDAAILIVEAMKNSGITGTAASVKEDRKKIRDYLAGINKIDQAVRGLTGFNYFDEYGNCPKPISIGVYRNKNIISALGQLQPVRYPDLIPDIGQAMAHGHVVMMDDKLMYKTNVVYTGIKVNRIDELDIKNASCSLDFYIWFRHQGDIDAQNIFFMNAVEPVQLESPQEKPVTKAQDTEDDGGNAEDNKAESAENKEDKSEDSVSKAKPKVMAKLVKEEKEGTLTSRLYHVKARFKGDFLGAQYGVDEYHILGVRFRHQELSRNNLIYVTDVLGMGLTGENSFAEQMKHDGVLGPEYGWNIMSSEFFQDVVEKSTMGDLKYLDIQNKFVECSQFNFRVLLKKDTFSVRRKISYNTSLYMTLFGIALIVLLMIMTTRYKNRFSKTLWFLKMVSSFLLLLSIEVVLNGILMKWLELRYLKLVVLFFDALWWLVPAFFIHLALDPFVWIPMQQQTGRPAPAVLRRFPAYIIYFVAGYGIIAFVLDQNINNLMATSGAVAMAAGLLVKDNIANYFASISIIQGYEIRIGHWVKIGDFEEGKVKEITKLATKVVTREGSMLSIPNSVILNSTIRNYSFPDDRYKLNFTLETTEEHSPDRVMNVIKAGLLATDGILKDPEPVVHFKGQGDSSAIFGVLFMVKDYEKKFVYLTAAWKSVWIHLQKAGIELATPHRIHHLIDETPKEVGSEE